MTNQERQKSIEKRIEKEFGEFKCGEKLFCCFCKKEKETPCAKAYNRMSHQTSYKTTTERARYSK